MSLTAKQEQALDLIIGPATNVMLFGGSRSGKTFLFVRSIVLRALLAPGSWHAIFRFRFVAVKSSIAYKTLPDVMRLCFPEVAWTLNKSDWFASIGDSRIWLAGLDEKERTEKVLGQEFATIYLNECSQIPWESRNIAMTRLAQRIGTKVKDRPSRELALKAYYDENPPDRSHWTYRLFVQKVDPETRLNLRQPEDYVALQVNPHDNRENLPPGYIDTVLGSLPARDRKRFLEGEFRTATPGALFPQEWLDRWRFEDKEEALPDMVRLVVAIDPSGAGDVDNADNDAIGIVVAGLGTDGNGYLLEDVTVKAGPATWGKVATSAFERHRADVVVAEINYGGAMVQQVIRTARPRTPCKLVTATRGKVVRAEPISALVESGKVRLAGLFPALEDELAGFTTNGYTGSGSPNRADAFVWAFSELFPGLVRVKEEAEPEPQRTGGWMAA